MTLLIDTGMVAPQDRPEFWARCSWDVYHPLEIRTDPSQPFWARMWGDWVDSVGVFRVTAAANTMSRSRREIQSGDPECLHLHVLLRGRLRGAQRGRETVLRPGEMTIYDTSAPTVFRAGEPFDLLVLKLPRATLGADAQRISRLAAVTISGDAELPRLARRFFCRTAAGLANNSISSTDVERGEHVRDLVRRLYRAVSGSGQYANGRSQAELLFQAHAYIEANLRDPELDPARVARGCFISTRYLHRIFEQEGLTVSAWIRAARLDRCRRDLLDPALAGEPIAAIAAGWGLRSAQHFSRLFHTTYGCSPRELRRSVWRAR